MTGLERLAECNKKQGHIEVLRVVVPIMTRATREDWDGVRLLSELETNLSDFINGYIRATLSRN